MPRESGAPSKRQPLWLLGRPLSRAMTVEGRASWCKTGLMPPDPLPIIARAAVIPVLTIERTGDAVPLARALVAGGLPVLEVTLRTDAALAAIALIAEQ